MAAPPDADAPPAGADAGSNDDAHGGGSLDERPPFSTWRGIYLLVLGALAVQVVLYAVLTHVLS